ncbi:CD1375 family protein [Neobacillus mesonae]|nr:CD1375 family protein [Neobacillus mesonae]
MLNMYTNAVKYGYMTIDQVPNQYQESVKENLGLTDEAPIE